MLKVNEWRTALWRKILAKTLDVWKAQTGICSDGTHSESTRGSDSFSSKEEFLLILGNFMNIRGHVWMKLELPATFPSQGESLIGDITVVASREFKHSVLWDLSINGWLLFLKK